MARSFYLKTAAIVALGVGILVGCNESDRSSSAPYAEPEAIQVTGSRAFSADEAAPSPEPKGEGTPQGGAMLAYSYSMGVSAPKGAVEPMMNAHQAKCVSAGPSVCQVLGASVNKYGEDQASAYLNLRAKPEWLETFRNDVASDAEGAGGKLTSNTVNAEDLTRYIIDLDARLEAKITLRDRIRILLENSEGSLSDILAAERALADVQGEIDSMTAQLNAAKARIAMSTLNISYQSDPETSVGLFKPLAEAFGDFGRTSVASLASAVRFVAGAWPFFIILMVVLAILRMWWRGRAKA